MNIGTYQCAVAQIAEKANEKLTPVSMKRVAEGMVPVEQKKCSRPAAEKTSWIWSAASNATDEWQSE